MRSLAWRACANGASSKLSVRRALSPRHALLAFVAARHTADSQSATHQIINSLFDRRSFAAAIVEGVPTRLGPSPANLRASVTDPEQAPPAAASWAIGEGGLTVRRAIAAGIPFWGGEPDQAEINAALRADGYTPSDILSTLLLRRIPQMLNTGLIDGASDPRLAAEFERMIAIDRRDLDPQPDFTLADFYAWYRDNFGNDFVAEAEISQRLRYRTDTKFGAIMHRMSAMRDAHLLDLITTRLETDRAVIVVYGGSHFTALQAELEALMGQPAFE